ncbi:MAG: glycosyltransferase family 2 protein [Coriobacteriales bacterium]
MARSSDVLVIIPAHNEEGGILDVVEGVLAVRPAVDYVVVNDGSSDGTGRLCHDNGVNVIDLPTNLGLAGAFRTGMKYADRHGYRFAVQVDADGQHDPSVIPEMRERAIQGANIVLGTRALGEGRRMSMRALGSRLISAVMFLITGKHISDPTCGLRLFDAPIIADFARRSYFSPEPDTIAHLIRRGARVAEVKIPDLQRETGSSYLTLSRSVGYMARVLVSLLVFPRRDTKYDMSVSGGASAVVPAGDAASQGALTSRRRGGARG